MTSIAPETPPTRAGRRPKRGEVLDAGVEEFLEKGYAGATLASIAERAGVSTATVFKHFRTKSDIFGAIMSRVFGNEADSLPPDPDAGAPREGLTDIGLDYASTIADPKIKALFRVMIAEVPRFPELGRELYEKGKRSYLERLETYLAAEAVAGTLSVADPRRAARQFLGMINDEVFWPHMLVVGLEDAPGELERVVAAAVDTALAAWARPTGP